MEIDLRYTLKILGYYKIEQDTLQQNLSKYYRFKKANTLCEKFNKFINTLKKIPMARS